MKLTAKLRLFWETDVITGADGIYSSCWIDVPLDQLEARGYKVPEYDPDSEEIDGEDWERLKEYYNGNLGAVPANAHPLMRHYGLPKEVQLRDTEWEETDEEWEERKKAQFPDWGKDTDDREALPYYNNPEVVKQCNHLGYEGKTICGLCGGILKNDDEPGDVDDLGHLAGV